MKKRSAKKKIKYSTPEFCYFTKTGTEPDYKEVLTLKRFITDKGKIFVQKRTGLTAKHQRALSQEIKRARFMGLLPYTDKHAI